MGDFTDVIAAQLLQHPRDSRVQARALEALAFLAKITEKTVKLS
jgi:hypothetical protein